MTEPREYPGRAMPEPGETWRHYKGGTYCVVCRAIDTVTLNVVVVYERLHQGRVDGVWVRPVGEFMGWVDKADTLKTFDHPGGPYRGPRFWKLDQ